MEKDKELLRKKRRLRRKRVRRRLFFVFEILCLLVLICGLFIFAKFEQMDYHDLNYSEIKVNGEVEQNQILKGYTTIALVGVDSREGNLENANSDTMIIANINNDNKEVKIVSLYRDTYLRVGEDEYGNGIYGKANSAYQKGSSEALITMLNTNFDLNIQEYVTVDFSAVARVTDILGGIDVELREEEVVHLNNYSIETSAATGYAYEPLEEVAGVHHLNGVQAVSYARIRYTVGMDMRRAARQREVIYKLVEKVKTADIVTLNKLVDEVFPMIRTSLSKSEILKLGMSILSYELVDQAGFPHDHLLGASVKEALGGVDAVLPITLESNVVWLHKFLFDVEDYVPSAEVQKYSDWVIQKSGFGEESRLEISEDGDLDSYRDQ